MKNEKREQVKKMLDGFAMLWLLNRSGVLDKILKAVEKGEKNNVNDRRQKGKDAARS